MLSWLALSSGFSGLLSQVICIRELLAVFSGNEFVIALTLAVWLVSSGAGSLLGGKILGETGGLAALLPLSIALPVAAVTAARWAPAGFLLGMTLDPLQVAGTSCVVLGPLAFIWGAVFAGLVKAAGLEEGGRIYAWEAAGAVLGGVAFLGVQSFSISSFAALTPVVLAQGAGGAVLFHRDGRRAAFWLVFGLTATAAVALQMADESPILLGRASRAWRVLERVSSPYGTLEASESFRGETVLSVDGVPVADTADVVNGEELAHYAMSQAPDHADVLLIGGGETGAAEEILKHGPRSVEVVEINPALVRLARERLGRLRDPRIAMTVGDPRRLVRRRLAAGRRFDIAVLGFGDPSTLALSRLYSEDFFRDVRRILEDGGVLALALSGSENYAGPAGRSLQASVFRAVRSAFPETLVLPGRRTFILGSGAPLSLDIAAGLDRRSVDTRFVRREYLSGLLTPDRLKQARARMEVRAETNRDSRPVALRYYLDFWLAQFRSGLFGMLGAGVLVAGLAVLLAIRSPSAGPFVVMATTGWAAMSLEVVLLFGFQVGSGSLYRDLGLLLGIFMGGSALGSAWARRHPGRLEGLEIAWLVLTGVTAATLATPARFDGTAVPGRGVFGLQLALAGLLAGAQYASAAARFGGKAGTAAKLYAVDLLGASAGAMLTSVWLLPAMGYFGTLAIVGSVKIGSWAFLRFAPLTPAWVRRAPWAWMAGMGVLVVMGVWVLHPERYVGFYSLSMRQEYAWLVGAFIVIGLAVAFGLRPGIVWTRAWRGVQFLIFAPVALFPILRCWFRIPYVFCHACPRPCVFGVVRPYMVWSGALMNVTSYPWCHHVCPVGLLLHAQPGARTGWVKRARQVRWWVFGFVVVAYFAGRWGVDHLGGWGEIYHFFLRNEYAVGGGVLASAAALLVLNLRLRRSFCNLLCPVGALMDFSRTRLSRAPLSSEAGGVE